VTSSSQTPLLVEEEALFQNMLKVWKDEIMVMGPDEARNKERLAGEGQRRITVLHWVSITSNDCLI
jgi:hypothetical protein